MDRADPHPTVLVVDDEPLLAAAYADALVDDYRVETAHSGEAAVDHLDLEPDVVLLDRRMPGLNGDDVVDAINARDLDTRVAMVTAVQPDFDIIDLGIDDYLVKPVDGDTIRETVEDLLDLNTYRDVRVELTTKRLKRNLLEVEKAPAVLAEHDGYAELEAEIEALEAELAAIEARFSGDPRRIEAVV